MINPLQTCLKQDNGDIRNIIIEPVLEKREGELYATGTYKILKDIAGEETVLFTEAHETTEPNNDIADAINPDYLGKIVIDDKSHWTYTGELLSADEQKQVAGHILKSI